MLTVLTGVVETVDVVEVVAAEDEETGIDAVVLVKLAVVEMLADVLEMLAFRKIVSTTAEATTNKATRMMTSRMLVLWESVCNAIRLLTAKTST